MEYSEEDNVEKGEVKEDKTQKEEKPQKEGEAKEEEKKYDVEYDVIFEDFKTKKKRLSKNSLKAYRDSLNMFCKANEDTLENIYNACGEEQVDKVKKNGDIIRFSPNKANTKTNQYFNKFTTYMEKNGNKPSTINKRVQYIKAFFKKMEIETPTWENLKEEKDEWELLSKDDINFVMNDSTLPYKALITFLLSTGMRESDACSLTIGDFMEATKKYHKCVNVEDFIDNAPKEMMGYWVFEPQKTERYDTHCKTFNSPESSNYILQNLKRIKNSYIPKKNEKNEKMGKEPIEISKKSYLFGSRKRNFLGKLEEQSVTDTFARKNKKLRTYHINNIDQKIAEGKISHEDRDEYIEKIPKFHPHALRKYFITTINSYGDYRTCLILEGHKSEIKTDESYIKIKKDDVEKVYNKALSDLTIEPIDRIKITDTEAEELREEINDTRKENTELRKENTELKNKLEAMEASQANIQTEMSAFKTQMDTIEENILENDITEFKKEVSKHPLIEEDGTLMELVMLMFKDKYKTDEITDSMAFIADELVTQAHVQKRADTRRRINWIKSNYGKKYDEIREKLESIKEDYFDSLELDDIPKTWIIKVDKEILEFCEDVLINNNKLNELEFYETIESITGLKYANEISLMNNLEKNYGWMSKK